MKVRLPNGQTATFPDGMPLAEVTAIIQKQFPPTGQIESRPQPDQPPQTHQGAGFFRGLSHVVPDVVKDPSMILQVPGAMVDLARHQLSQGDITGAIIPGVLPAVRQLAGDVAQQSAESYQHQRDQGRSVPVAALAGMPIAGPAGARMIENVASGEPERMQEGLGEGVGLAASLLAGPAARVTTNTPRVALGNWLRRSGSKQYEQALGATGRIAQGTKQTAAEVTPGLIERGVIAGTRPGLMEKLSKAVNVSDDALTEALATLPKDMATDVSIAYRELNQLKLKHAVKAKDGSWRPTNARAAHTISLIDDIQRDILASKATVENIRKFRTVLGHQKTAGKKAFGATVGEGTELGVTKEAYFAVRKSLSDATPDIAKLDKELSFWLKAEEVLESTIERTGPQATPLGQTMGQMAGVAGALAGGASVGRALITGQIIKAVKAATESTGWRTVSAVVKDRLAAAMIAGDVATASAIAGRIVAGAPKEQSRLGVPTGAVARLNAFLTGRP